MGALGLYHHGNDTPDDDVREAYRFEAYLFVLFGAYPDVFGYTPIQVVE